MTLGELLRRVRAHRAALAVKLVASRPGVLVVGIARRPDTPWVDVVAEIRADLSPDLPPAFDVELVELSALR